MFFSALVRIRDKIKCSDACHHASEQYRDDEQRQYK
jgi:hypothetical protein